MGYLYDKNFALVIVAMQKYFLENVVEEKRDKVISTNLEIMRYANQKNQPILLVEDIWGGPINSDIYNEFNSIDGTKFVFEKSESSTFLYNKTYEVVNRDWGLNTVLITGVYYAQCVRNSAKDAVKRGLDVIVAEQLMAPYKPTKKNPGWHKEAKLWYKKTEKIMFFDNYLDLII